MYQAPVKAGETTVFFNTSDREEFINFLMVMEIVERLFGNPEIQPFVKDTLIAPSIYQITSLLCPQLLPKIIPFTDSLKAEFFKTIERRTERILAQVPDIQLIAAKVRYDLLKKFQEKESKKP